MYPYEQEKKKRRLIWAVVGLFVVAVLFFLFLPASSDSVPCEEIEDWQAQQACISDRDEASPESIESFMASWDKVCEKIITEEDRDDCFDERKQEEDKLKDEADDFMKDIVLD